ncbi:MAG TPA: helix-turn-helix transcriptional regulator, partial [Acidimicrobiia bacterium]
TVRLEEVIAPIAGTATARAASCAARGLVTDEPEPLVAAAALYGQAGRPLYQLLCAEWAGASLARAQRQDDAIAQLRVALDLAVALEAEHDGRRLQAALRELGVRLGSRRRGRRDVTGWDALTDAEQQVAILVGEGLRNPEIAERLFISRRTVESHVSHLYTKLAVSTRVALANLVRERHPV